MHIGIPGYFFSRSRNNNKTTTHRSNLYFRKSDFPLSSIYVLSRSTLLKKAKSAIKYYDLMPRNHFLTKGISAERKNK
jgi:hypothetical protein